MQLTDEEIRRIIIRERRKKRRILRRRRRIALLIAAVICIALIVVLATHKGGTEPDGAAAEGSRGVIFIDPGHGGEDPGSFVGDRKEKDDTLRLALRVADHLRADGFTVVLSRTEDVTVERPKRGEMANDCGAQLMISIHRNKAKTGNGVEAFIPMADTPESRMLGENIINALGSCGFEVRTVRPGTLTNSNEDYEELAVTKMPTCLVEVGFISNESDNALFDLSFDDNAKAIAGAISDTYTALYEQDQQTEEPAAEQAEDQAAEQTEEQIGEPSE